MRIRARLRGQPFSSANAERERDYVFSKMLPSVRQGEASEAADTGERQTPEAPSLHPYFGFEWTADNQTIGRDREYFRGDESRETLDIMIVGGSVAAHFGNTGAEVLIRLLQADPSIGTRGVRVLSYGRAGFKQPQQLMLVAFLLGLGFTPDVLVNIDGFNEAALANANVEAGVHPAYPSASHWSHLASARQSDREAMDILYEMRARQDRAARLIAWVRDYHLGNSALLCELTLARLRVLRKQYSRLGAAYVKHLTDSPAPEIRGPPVPTETSAVQDLVLETWFESSRSIDALCRARSIPYVHVLQPTLHDSGSKPLTPEEIESGACGKSSVDGVHYAYPRMRRLGAELRDLGVRFVDASDVFQDTPETLYHDPCHFGARGIALLAPRVADAILETWKTGH